MVLVKLRKMSERWRTKRNAEHFGFMWGNARRALDERCISLLSVFLYVVVYTLLLVLRTPLYFRVARQRMI